MRVRSFQVAGDKVPVHNVPESFDVSVTFVEVVHIVCMLPNIASQQYIVPVGEGNTSIGRVDNLELSVLVLAKPGPTRAEIGGTRLQELLFEIIH